MDGDRFDTLARSLSLPRSRRAALSSAAAGGLLSALGLTRAVPEARAVQGGTCVVEFAARLQQGPSREQALTPNGGRTGEAQGYLSFSMSRSGSLDNATLTLPDGTSLPVVGDATGHGLRLRITLGPRRALVAVGVGEQAIARCLGAIDGVVMGPESGDLGDWHATAGVQNIPSGGQSSTGATQRTAAGAGGASAGAGSERTGRAGRSDRGATGAPGTGNAAGTGQDPSCPRGETYCPYVEECRDLRTSPLDCGACGTRCPSLVCQDGRCLSEDEADQLGASELQCTEGRIVCPNIEDPSHPACVDLQTDALNCGACGNRCPINSCSGGVCGGGGNQNCAPPLAVCGEVCADTKTDPNNCGACGTACATGETCSGGTCAPPATAEGACPEGQVRCGDACTEALPNFGSDGISCPGGASPTACPAGRVLCNGACFPDGACQPAECAPGWGYCYGVCRDFQSDPGACGGCSTACPGGICSGGTCVTCPAGQLACGATCVDVQTDLDNCGFCGNLCGTQCIDGQCTGVGPAPTCAEGTTRCGDACVDLARDSANCGQCGNSCTAIEFCAPPGVCNVTEEYCQQSGKHSCGTYCTTFHDPENCGGCGLLCPGGLVCNDEGRCYVTGNSPHGAGTVEPRQTLAPTDSPADAASAESPGPQALAPADVESCPPGQVDCGGVCVDVASDPFNCGGCGLACEPGVACASGACVGDLAQPAAAPEEMAPACAAAGEPCDPVAPGACCSGACTGDGTCA